MQHWARILAAWAQWGVNGIPVYADSQLKQATGMTTGANKDGFHIRNVNVARDLSQVQFLDLRTVREGELSAEGQPLKIRRAIEVEARF